MEYKHKITMKNGSVLNIETKWLDLRCIETELNNYQPYIRIGNTILAKDEISSIEENKPTEEKEN